MEKALIYYHFTNDSRFQNLKENLYAVSQHIEKNIWEHPNQTLEQAKNGWYPLYVFYFGLYKGANNCQLVLTGKWNYVLGEFVKKLQFPNPKPDKKNFYNLEINNNQKSAPLRTLIKILFYAYEHGGNSVLTIDDFGNYILANNSLVIQQVPITTLYKEIQRKLGQDNFEKNLEVNGGDKKRFVKQLLGILSQFNFIAIKNNTISLNFNYLSTEDKAILLDIVTFDDYWSPSEKEAKELSYREYMQSKEETDRAYQNLNPSIINTKYPHNRIFFGAPGTGKSYRLNHDKDQLVGTKEQYERVTFYPDYSYANFVGTYKPVMHNDEISYEYVPGPFLRIYTKAIKNIKTSNPLPYLLIIEEINRANVSGVFGDVFQLLDRNENNVSEYAIAPSEDIKKYLVNELGGTTVDYDEIRIPSNMFIWGTMNNADQGVFPMDTAFKRRWNFEYFGVDDSESKIAGLKVKLGQGDFERLVEWNKLRKAINDELAFYKLNEDKMLGPFFLSLKNLNVNQTNQIIGSEEFINVFKSKIIMYLFEDAARQKRSMLFDTENSSRYSAICKEFDEKGVFIFNQSISSQFYEDDVE